VGTQTNAAETSTSATATVAFIDLAGFSAIADVYGDALAIEVLEGFEALVRAALKDYDPPIKWIGDAAMLAFPDPETAIQALGKIVTGCRKEPRLPLTRAGINHGPVIRRGGDLFGSTVNIAARITARATPGQLLATQAIADAAMAKGILVRDLGKTALRSIAVEVPLYAIELADAADPAWIDPVCKMHAPFRPASSDGPYLCSPQCEEAYRKAPHAYPRVQ
jgi:adenylate cyclase